MLSFAKHLRSTSQCIRHFRSEASPTTRRRRPKSPPSLLRPADQNSEWWIVDGEMHEIGDNVPPRERFVIPRDNLPNRRRKQLREQFMRRTRLVFKETEHELFCNKYMELYQELRENWERLYWDEGYSKKIARDHANYESAEDDDQDFSPYRSRPSNPRRMKEHSFVNEQGDTWEQANLIRDKFEYDREKRMRDKAFAPMHSGPASRVPHSNHNQQWDIHRYFPQNEQR